MSAGKHGKGSAALHDDRFAVKHVLGLSGGRDSAALAVYMRQHHPELDIEYFFTDTGKELPEVYEYLGRLEGFLGQPDTAAKSRPRFRLLVESSTMIFFHPHKRAGVRDNSNSGHSSIG